MSNLTYKLMGDNGVKRSDGACIPNCDDNRDWRLYQEWLSEGNTPEPQFTPEEIAAKALAEEISDIKTELRSAMVWQFRMIVELWKALKANTAAQNSDIDPDVLSKAAGWMTKLDRLKEIDE